VSYRHPYDGRGPGFDVFLAGAGIEVRPHDHHVAVEEQHRVGLGPLERQVPSSTEAGLVIVDLGSRRTCDLSGTIAARAIDDDQSMNGQQAPRGC